MKGRNRKWKRFAASFLTAAMLLQQCSIAGLAEESAVQSEQGIEAQAEIQAPQAEAETQAPQAEAQTQAPQTEAETQAPQTEAETQAPQTEAQTQAPQTESQTQAPQTEAQTQAPQTEAQTQAPQTEAQTQAPQTEKATETQTEKETAKETAKETETERAERVNSGKKIKKSMLISGLKGVMPFLFAAEKLEGTEKLFDEKIVDEAFLEELTRSGAEGDALVSGLNDLSKTLANGKSTSEVKVINLYADKKGKLDIRQMKEAFADQTLDVSSQMVVVNVIAAKQDQTLEFSGYPIREAGQAVTYSEDTKTGAVIYNFAALEKNKYKTFGGTVNLSSDSGLQGTFLAPGAAVNVNSDLAGAVYAKQIAVAESVEELIRVPLTEDAEEELEPETDGETDEPDTEAVTEAKETETEEVSDAEETEEADTEAVTEAEEADTETVTEAEETDEPDTEAVTETAETKEAAGTETVTDTESTEAVETEEVTEATETVQTEMATEVAETESSDAFLETLETVEAVPNLNEEAEPQESETESTEDALDAEFAEIEETGLLGGADMGWMLFSRAGILNTGNPTWYSEEGVSFKLRLADAEKLAAGNQEALLTGGTAVIHAAYPVIGADGQTVCAADAEVSSLNWEGNTEIAAELHYGGEYYLELTIIPAAEGDAAYLAPAPIFFRVTEEGKVAFEETDNETDGRYVWNGDVLTIPLYNNNQAQAVVTLTAEDSGDGIVADLSGAAFVLKDETGKVLCGEDGYPSHYFVYEQEPFSLYGLKPGTYYLSQIQAPTGYRLAKDQPIDREIIIPESSDKPAAEPVRLTVTYAKETDESTGKTLALTEQAVFTKVTLTAEQEQQFYIALFEDAELKKRVSDVKTLSYQPGNTGTGEVIFAGLEAGKPYYVGAVDAFGSVLQDPEFQLQVSGRTDAAITIAETDAQKTAALVRNYTEYPTDLFSYEAEVRITKEVKGLDGKDKPVSEIFFAMLYTDPERTTKALANPVKLNLAGKASVTASVKVKMTDAAKDFYIAETNGNGEEIRTDKAEFPYGISYPNKNDRRVTVNCGSDTSVVVRNQLNSSIVKFRLENEKNGTLLAGASLVVKNQKTGEVTDIFVSGEEETVWENKLPAGEYLLTEVTAPSGYANTADVSFTVQDGMTTEVIMKNKVLAKTGYALTAVKQVYCGDSVVYAQDKADGTYAKEGRYTFYAALFSDAKRTRKVSDVQKITVSALSGKTVFNNLAEGKTYYLAETDQYGTVLTSTKSQEIQYSGNGKVAMSSKNCQVVIRNSYSSLPKGYRHTATLTITKKLQSASGAPDKANRTFYAGIYRKSDYSDKPTVVSLKLDNASEAFARRRILLSGSKDVTYYIAELNEKGQRVTNQSDFGYTIDIDSPEVTLAGGDDKQVTITNRTRVSRVTLYLTKKVYQGTEKKAVNETFYAGLFKDSEFTQLYANPIPLRLEGKSELTLKLSLNLGSASEATIYVAEVDADGKVVQAGQKFGYDIRVVNAKAEFTQERTEIQSILLNSVYSASSGGNWNQILSHDGNNIGLGFGGGHGGEGFGSGWGWGSNGDGGASENGSVQTGDETPILLYVVMLIVSILVLTGAAVYGTRRRKIK